jgi:ABC-type transport system involved in multi-copper enzyme maturation permease subunit
MPLHDAHYQHWGGAHTGIWGRRWVIAQNGLSACLRSKLLRYVVLVSWVGGLLMAAFLFFLGQLLVPDSNMTRWVMQISPDIRAFVRMFTSWLQDHPEVSVGTTQNVLFYYYGVYSMPLSIIALGMALPALITRDLASNAILIYSSKAVTRGDYLLGKFCTAFGVMTLTWLGPLCGAWFVGNLLAPDWTFFWHARIALIHVLIFGLSSMAVLSLLALGVSAVSSREKSTPALWFTWWVQGLAIQPIALHTLQWLRHLSFGYNLKQIALAVFHLGRELQTAQDSIPILGQLLRQVPPATRAALDHPLLGGAVMGLAVMLLTAALIVNKRVVPE